MLYFSKIRIFIIVIFTFILAYLTTSNFFSFDDGFIKKKINLGLDLQGGSYLLLEIDNEPVITQRLQNKVFSLRKYFKDENIKFKNLSHNDKVSKISVVGAGMVATPGVTYKMFRGLADENINILAISTSEIKISVIINENDTLKAVKKLHTIFDLD